MSAESITGYPRWQGALTRGGQWWTIAKSEIVQAYYDKWTGYAFVVFLAISALRVASRTAAATSSIDDFVQTLSVLDWGALAVAATVTGPAILEDVRKGALELYLSRSASRFDYLFGKAFAVFSLTFAVVALPGLVYWGASIVTSDVHPDGWGWVWLGILGHAAIWGFVIAGLGLGLSCVMRSARAASLVLFGGVAVMNIILGSLLSAISRTTSPQVLSPIASLEQQSGWLFPGAHLPYDFPFWGGLITLGVLAVLGWGAVWWRHPRLKGVE